MDGAYNTGTYFIAPVCPQSPLCKGLKTPKVSVDYGDKKRGPGGGPSGGGPIIIFFQNDRDHKMTNDHPNENQVPHPNDLTRTIRNGERLHGGNHERQHQTPSHLDVLIAGFVIGLILGVLLALSMFVGMR